MVFAPAADFPLVEHADSFGSTCRHELAVATQHDAEFHELVAEIRRIEGATLDDPPLLFKAVVALGAAALLGGAAGLVLGILPLVARLG